MKAALLFILACLTLRAEGQVEAVAEATAATAAPPSSGAAGDPDFPNPRTEAERKLARHRYRGVWHDKLIAMAKQISSEEAKKTQAVLEEIWASDDEYRSMRDSLRAKYRAGEISKADYKDKSAEMKKPSRNRLGQLRDELKTKLAANPNESKVDQLQTDRDEGVVLTRHAKRWRKRILVSAADQGYSKERLQKLQKELTELLKEQQKTIDYLFQSNHGSNPDAEEHKREKERLRQINVKRRQIEVEFVGDKSGNDALHERRLRTTKLSLVVWKKKLMKKVAGMKQDFQMKVEKEADSLIDDELSLVGKKELWPEPGSPKTSQERAELRRRVKELKEARKGLVDGVERKIKGMRAVALQRSADPSREAGGEAA